MKEENEAVQQLRHDDLVRENQEKTNATIEETASIGAVEPWLPIETKMVVGSLIIGGVALIILGILVHIFILGGQ
ncbi:MAG: hypothetical protein PVG39_16860 [Desulfobacteraceae bacterium]